MQLRTAIILVVLASMFGLVISLTMSREYQQKLDERHRQYEEVLK